MSSASKINTHQVAISMVTAHLFGLEDQVLEIAANATVEDLLSLVVLTATSLEMVSEISNDSTETVVQRLALQLENLI